jgi:protease-4
MPLRTDSKAEVNARVQGNVVMTGKMDAKVRSEVQPLVDIGPLYEVPVGHCGASGCKVAVLDIDGVLTNVNHTGPFSVGENPVAVFKEKLDACAADPEVKAVVLRINTPGGGVAATDLMWHDLIHFRQSTGKPVVACLLDLGAGGGYFLATGCDSIVAIPSSVVGGIGVMLNIYWAEDGMAMINVFDDSIRSGEKIDMGSSVRKLTREEKKILRGMAEGYHETFKKVVTQTRPRVKADADLFDGRVMTGPQAVEAGLVDVVGYLDDAVCLASKMAKTEGVQAIMYRRQGDAARSLYASTPNRPIHTGVLPLSIPGPDRSKLPLFLYMWQPEPTLLKQSGT